MTEQPAPLRMIVADDQASVREGLVLLLDLLADIEVVASASDGQEAIDLCGQYRPDAILLDLHMPGVDGIQATRHLSEHFPEIAIVVLTTYADDSSVLAALGAGARSYLTKDADRVDIANAVRSSVTGLGVLGRSIQATLVDAATRAQPPDKSAPRVPDHLPDGLTKREAQILTMMAGGMGNPEIAAALFLSPHTVKSHVNRIFAKTGSLDRATAVGYASDHGLG
ncbi:MAG: response regulator transcription factor [Acidimicrobiales bacterium]